MFELPLEELQRAKNEKSEYAPGHAKTNLSAAETQTNDGYEPERGGGRDAMDPRAAFQVGSAADEAHRSECRAASA